MFPISIFINCWRFIASTANWQRLPLCDPQLVLDTLEMVGNQIVEFSEKPQTKEGWINGAFFVLEPEVFNYIDGDNTHWEKEPLERLARDGQLMAYRHSEFWQCMDTIREKRYLEGLWEAGNAPWKIWEERNAHISDGARRLHRNGAGTTPAAVSRA